MNILRLLLLMPTLALASDTSSGLNITGEEGILAQTEAGEEGILALAGETAQTDVVGNVDTTVSPAEAADILALAGETAQTDVVGNVDTTVSPVEAADIEAGLEEAEEADIASGLPNCTQYKIDFNTNNCTCNSGSTCSDKKSYYETNCINNC